jgi:flagellar biosynthesis/type III secretory pathway protein FliH
MMARAHSSAFSLLSDFGREKSEFKQPDPEVQLKSAFDDGYQQGLSEGRAEAQADAELQLAESEALHAEKLKADRQAFERDCAEVLAARLDAAMSQIERAVAERVADYLRPWLVEQLRVRAMQGLESAIGKALSGGAKVHIEAPADVLAYLRDRLPAEGFQIGYSESATSDIRAHIEDTEIEANISTWVAELEALTE